MKHKAHRYLLYYLLIFFLKVISFLPRSLIVGLTRFFALTTYYLLRKERQKIFHNLDYAYGDTLSFYEKKKIAKGVALHIGSVFGDMMKLSRMSVEQMIDWVEVSDDVREKFQAVREKYEGGIVVTGHLGNWELLASFLHNTFNEGKPSYVVARRIYFEKFNEVLVSLRRRFGIRTFYRDDPFRKIIKTLKEGYGMGLLVDQDVSSIPGIFVDFFGKKAYTTDAAARLGYLSGAPLFLFFMIRDGKKYRLLLEDVLWFDATKDREEEIHRLTQEYTTCIEKVIRRYPEQWVWMHNRWKTKMSVENKVEVSQ